MMEEPQEFLRLKTSLGSAHAGGECSMAPSLPSSENNVEKAEELLQDLETSMCVREGMVVV